MADVTPIEEKTATYPLAVYTIMMSGKQFDPASMAGGFAAFDALSNDQKYKELPEEQRLTDLQKNHVTRIVIGAEAGKIFEERLMKWGKPLREQIVSGLQREGVARPAETQIMAKTKEVYIATVPQWERDAGAEADYKLATQMVEHKLPFNVTLPINLVPKGHQSLEERVPLYPNRPGAQPAAALLEAVA